MSRNIRRIAMLSTHGYFDPVPILGQTDTGGQVVYVLELAKALARLGYKTDIFTRWFDRSRPPVDPVPGVPDVRVVRIPAGPWEFVTKEEIYEFLPELTGHMIRSIEDNRLDYDLYHGHYVDAGIVTIDLASHFSRPSFFTAHSLGAWKREQMGGDPAEMEKKFNFSHRIQEELRILNTASAHTVTSALQEEKIRELYDYPGQNIEVIPPGVDVHRYQPLAPGEQKINTGLPEKYIYCLSRIDSNKGHDLLLHAFHQVLKAVPDVWLVIGGGSPSPKPREQEVFAMMRELITEFGISDRVKFVGYVSEELMLPYYQNASMFVMPSIFEPFGMTTQEAMACGIPVVASRYGGIRTVLTHEVNGLLVDPKDREEFSGTMVRLLQDGEWNQNIGKEASILIRDHFSWEAIAQRHLDFYSEYSA